MDLCVDLEHYVLFVEMWRTRDIVGRQCVDGPERERSQITWKTDICDTKDTFTDHRGCQELDTPTEKE